MIFVCKHHVLCNKSTLIRSAHCVYFLSQKSVRNANFQPLQQHIQSIKVHYIAK